jgi:hypothetical protein
MDSAGSDAPTDGASMLTAGTDSSPPLDVEPLGLQAAMTPAAAITRIASNRFMTMFLIDGHGAQLAPNGHG